MVGCVCQEQLGMGQLSVVALCCCVGLDMVGFVPELGGAVWGVVVDVHRVGGCRCGVCNGECCVGIAGKCCCELPYDSAVDVVERVDVG